MFAAMTLCIKLVSDTIPLGQVVFFRSAFALIPLVVFLYARREFPAGLSTKRPLGHLLRSGFGTIGMFTSFAAIARLPLADATLVNYVTPLLTALLGGLMLGETLTRSRYTGIFLGMAGVLVLTLPQFSGEQIDTVRLAGYAFGLVSAGFSALAMIQIRRLGTTESPGAIAFYFVVVAMLASLPSAGSWASPTVGEYALLITAGIFGGLAHIAMTLAYRYAEVSLLAPFEYLTIVWATVIDVFILHSPLGIWFFAALPLLLSGATVSSGLLGKLRPRRRSVQS